ncbi:hypothetical protein F4561_003821 [Lipingzhangella halophila]|uniref:NACHT domain-containing protein n=1 Tax=Lipingzhangella halophila TaxID=1783352 RepID=A0A7W7W3P4_9ACTN|nr:NACHT domain-containing protein [Lipingzhangella halophila]MBB4933001.1 hypothetical protein [Lipingzhangella halophila]
MGNLRSTIGLIFFGILMPGIAGYTLSELVRDQPWIALGVLVAYEALVVTLTPVGGAVGIWQQQAAKWIYHRVQGLVPGFGRRYRDYLRRSSKHVDQSGMQTSAFFSPALDDVFIDVDLVKRSPGEVRTDVAAAFEEAKPPRERSKLGDYLRSPHPETLAVLGAPGSGKTTLLRRAVHDTCKAGNDRRNVPILLAIRDHVRTITGAPETGLPDVLRASLKRSGLVDPPGWFERRLDRGECVVLLDGLDEVPRDEDRQRVADWVHAQIARYPENHFVVTSRAHRYWETRIEPATVLETQRLTPEQVHHFIHDWYLAIERGTNESYGGAHSLAQEGANDLLGRLAENPELLKLTVNPLMLTMTANVHRERGALPDNRAQLYREAVEGMLWRMSRRRSSIRLSGEQREVVLRELAFAMMRDQTHDLKRSEILDMVAPRLARVSQRVSPHEFITDAVVSGLVIERDGLWYSFAHHTFQEYLASEHMKEAGLPEGKKLVQMVRDDWWRETLFLYAARDDATPIVQACLDVGTVNALALALDCVDQARELAPELRDQMDRMLQDAFDSDSDPERRRLARAWALRFLREDVELPNSGGRLCARPITVGLYRLFLARRAKEGEHTPDTAEFTDDTPDSAVVVGVRAADATAFVQWINEVLGDEITFGNDKSTFRLPTREELAEYSIMRGHPYSASSLWTRSEPSPKLWAPKGFLGRTVNDTTLTQQAKEDVHHSQPLVMQLLLIRSVRFLDALGCTVSPDCGLGPDRINFLFHALGRDPAQRIGVDLPRVLAHDLTRCLGIVRSLVDGDERVSAHTDAVERAHQLARQLDHTRAGYGQYESSPDRTHKLVLRSSRELATAFADIQTLDSSQIVDPDLAPQGPPFDPIMGRAFSDALTTTLTAATQWAGAPQFVEDLAQNLVMRVKVGSGLYHPAPEALAKTTSETCGDLSAALTTAQDRSVPHAWAHAAARRLDALAVPVFSRQEKLTPTTATTIRLLALALAAEADRLGAPRLGHNFRTTAAGVTLLRRRLSGEARATETIMLAVD